MTQPEINRAVAHATGESLRTIAQRGFSIEQPLQPDDDLIDVLPQVVDWDALEVERWSAAA